MIVRYIRGTVTGNPEHLAAEGQLYPTFHWQSGLEKVQIGENGVYGFTPKESLTANFGPDIRMNGLIYEAWDGSKIIEQAPIEGPTTNIAVSVNSD